MHRFFFLFAFGLLIGSIGCTPTPSAVPYPGLYPALSTGPVVKTPTLASASPSADLVISPDQFGPEPILVTQGKIIAVLSPSDSVQWEVSYDGKFLTAITPAEKMRAPGPGGWLFRTTAPGTSDFMLTSIPQPCPGSAPCPSMPARLTLTIVVEK